jgi:hypothetical protein
MELGLAKTAPLSVIGVELIPQEEASLRYPDRWAVISAKYASCARRGWFRCRRSADSLTGAIFGPLLLPRILTCSVKSAYPSPG